MRRASAACAAVVACVVAFASTAQAAAGERDAQAWAGVLDALDDLADEAGAAAGAESLRRGAGDATAPVLSSGRVAELLSRLDGAADDGAAEATWRALFGSGAVALTPTGTGPPAVRARFADSADAARFVQRRLARARRTVLERQDASPGAAALERRIRSTTAGLGSPPRTELHGGGLTRCGPVHVRATGDTAALGDLCADLDRYWSVTGSEAVRVDSRRTGAVPAAERRVTAAASAVEAVVDDVEASAGRPPPKDVHDDERSATEARPEAAPVPQPQAGPQPVLPARSGRGDPVAPVLAAVRLPSTWMPAAGGAAALAIGLLLVRRVRERCAAGVLR